MKKFSDTALDLSTSSQVALEVKEVERVATLVLNGIAPSEPHVRVITALFQALNLMADAHPCCRDSMARMAMQAGLHFACVPPASPSHQVH